jgi:hypothetical protein
MRRTMVQELFAMAEMVGATSTAAIVFEDKGVAQDILSTLQSRPNIISAAIFTPDGKPFAEFVRNGARHRSSGEARGVATRSNDRSCLGEGR